MKQLFSMVVSTLFPFWRGNNNETTICRIVMFCHKFVAKYFSFLYVKLSKWIWILDANTFETQQFLTIESSNCFQLFRIFYYVIIIYVILENEVALSLISTISSSPDFHGMVVSLLFSFYYTQKVVVFKRKQPSENCLKRNIYNFREQLPFNI